MKEKSPAFQFYPKDWLADPNVRAMTHAERGIYIDLLCSCWTEGSIPDDPEECARIAGWFKGGSHLVEPDMKRIIDCFRVVQGWFPFG